METMHIHTDRCVASPAVNWWTWRELNPRASKVPPRPCTCFWPGWRLLAGNARLLQRRPWVPDHAGAWPCNLHQHLSWEVRPLWFQLSTFDPT